MRSYVVIPARAASTRLPNKMLLATTGRSLIEHTYENACRAKLPAGVIVATDHHDIAQAIVAAGGHAVMTSPDCASGTDRVAEVAQTLPDADVLVNVQGDEPELDPTAIDQLIELLEANPTASMATLASPIRSESKALDPSCVKVVFDAHGQALYFSRSPIPFVRDADVLPVASDPPLFYQHVGIYAYRREFLLELAHEEPSSLELAEKLEQLRVLQMGRTIAVGVIDHAASGIDTPEDYQEFVERQRAA